MGDYDVTTGSWRFWLGLSKVLRQGFRVCWHGIAEGIGFWHESYTEELWTEELHQVFALEVCVSGMFHHVFTLDSLSGSYHGHVVDAPGGLCLVAVSYLDICVSWTDKPLWLDGYLWLDDSLRFIFKLSLNIELFRVYILVHLYSISLAQLSWDSMPSVLNLVLFTLKHLIADLIPSHLFIFVCSLALLAAVATFFHQVCRGCSEYQ